MPKIKMGNVREVENTSPRPNASASYLAVWVEDENGDNERCLMFKKLEFGKLPEFAFPKTMDVEEDMKTGRLYGLSYGTTVFYVMKVVVDGKERVVKLTDKKIEIAERLAEMNSEDIPDRGVLNDMLD